jgi:tricorn protease
VVPVESERDMRSQEWIDGNVRKTTELSGGQVAYLYLPNTAGAGFDSFNRYFFAQSDRGGGGGRAVEPGRGHRGLCDRRAEADAGAELRVAAGTADDGADGGDLWAEGDADQPECGVGGDAMPRLFRQAKLGPLVGVRTWGGLVGIGGYPVLPDGGSVTAPRTALYGLKGEFEVENRGIAPDVEVEDDPKAVAIVMEELKKNPPPSYGAPPYPNYHKSDGLAGSSGRRGLAG